SQRRCVSESCGRRPVGTACFVRCWVRRHLPVRSPWFVSIQSSLHSVHQLQASDSPSEGICTSRHLDLQHRHTLRQRTLPWIPLCGSRSILPSFFHLCCVGKGLLVCKLGLLARQLRRSCASVGDPLQHHRSAPYKFQPRLLLESQRSGQQSQR
ncbi:hypothetical protein LTR16_011402, partial [Cryomyces antarcticus]